MIFDSTPPKDLWPSAAMELAPEFPGVTMGEIRDAVRHWRERPKQSNFDAQVAVENLTTVQLAMTQRMDRLEKLISHHDHPYPEACQDTIKQVRALEASYKWLRENLDDLREGLAENKNRPHFPLPDMVVHVNPSEKRVLLEIHRDDK